MEKKNPLELYYPINTIKEVANNIWIVDGEMIRMNLFGVKVPFTTRMTIVKLEDGTLWCHSPIKLTENLIEAIHHLGEVKHLVSPNKIHYAFIPEWQVEFPNAITWASPGVKERAKAKGIDISFDYDLTEEVPEYWGNILNQHLFKGSRYMEEVVFFHKPSKSLILTDLIENFELNKTHSCFWRQILKIGGHVDPDGKTPSDLRMSFFGNKELARKSLELLLSWEPEKIILSHGRWYQENGKAELKRAFRWLL